MREVISMAFLVCKHCNNHYEIHSKVKPVDIGNCYCGNKLVYYPSLEEYHNEKENDEKSIFLEDKSRINKMHITYNIFLNQKKVKNVDLIKEIAPEFEPYCVELTFAR